MEIKELVTRLRAQGRADVADLVLATAAQPAPRRVATADDFVSASEAADALDLSLNTVKRRVATGLLRGYKDPSNGYVYVHKDSVVETLETRDMLRASAALPGAEPPRLPTVDRRQELATAGR